MNPKQNFVLADRLRVASLVVFLYFGGIVAILVLSSLGIIPRSMASKEVILFLFAPLFAFNAVIGHLTGELPARLGVFERSRDPVSFWIATSFCWLCAIGFVVAGIAAARGFPK